MTKPSANPKNIYLDVESKINDVLISLNSAAKESRLQEEFQHANAILAPHAAKLKDEIRALESYAEWNTFVMAFYGETGAGKSTIIETLRIILKESSKSIEQEQFRATQLKFNITENRISELQGAAESAEHHLNIVQIELRESDERNKKAAELERVAIDMLEKRMDDLKRAASFWQKIIWLFKKMPEIDELNRLQQTAKISLQSRDTIRLKVPQKIVDAREARLAAINELEMARVNVKKLEQYADGNIIGKGNSDNTVKTQKYCFTAHGQKFILLDVPGIEGHESMVIDSVHSAVKTAHAVFYVVASPGPPQKGDDVQKGTLEKIKEHLSAQTEVWRVFNKRVTNPIQIENGLMIGDDEQESIAAADQKMTEQLQTNYRGTISLSAHPAFLAAASHMVPGSDHLSSKEKFARKISGKDVLEKTGMNAFYRLVAQDLVSNARSKIFYSNFSKAKSVVADANKIIANLLKINLIPLQRDLKTGSENTNGQLASAFESLNSRIHSSGERATGEFIEALRKTMYEVIERDISNDEFKSSFEYCLKEQQTSLTSVLSTQIESESKKFETQIASILDRYKELAQDSVDAYSQLKFEGLDADIDLKIDIKNGINVPNLIVAAIGGAMLLWSPAGWIVLAMSATTIIVNLYKALRSSFDSNYKKGQQRESVNENLGKVHETMRSSMQESLENALPKLEQKLDQLQSKVQEPVQQLSEAITILKKAEDHFKKIVHDIDVQLATEINLVVNAA